ncbi:hypothetical protein PoB_006113800 [Plakobranchus ocellatus]|uniref:Uncharacterized protein n=1 Tax=Plakobranchus ocellatus TaxID=259542 RepID=A0AAV4CRU8_9GAST|nr:hypothetical protein PoB_006113800 [Plakobranchus ocellatus]
MVNRNAERRRGQSENEGLSPAVGGAKEEPKPTQLRYKFLLTSHAGEDDTGTRNEGWLLLEDRYCRGENTAKRALRFLLPLYYLTFDNDPFPTLHFLLKSVCLHFPRLP